MHHPPKGHLDTTFGGGDGMVVTGIPNLGVGAFGLAIVSGGKIVVGGETFDPNGVRSDDLALIRYLPGGQLDTTFGGGDGKVTVDLFGGTDIFEEMTVDGNGRAVIVTETEKNGDFVPALVRFEQNGSLDHSFSGDGAFVVPVPGTNSFMETVTTLGGGKIVVGGEAVPQGGPDEDFLLMRVNAGGGVDTSFGTAGHVFTDFDNGADIADALRVDASGRIVAGGQATVGGEAELAVARYTGAGHRDTSFSGDGRVATDVGGFDRVFGLAIRSGKIVAVGRSDTDGGNERWVVARYGSGGALDAGFGTDGRTITNFSTGPSEEEATGVVIESGGRIVASGFTHNHPALAGYVG